MISNQTFDNYPEFANSGTKSKPNDVKYAAGFVPSDVLPAEWLNWFLNGATKGVTALNTGVAELEKELNNILAQVSASADPSQHDQVVTAIISLIENRTGLLSNLTTTEKTNIVASINELVSTIAGNGSAAGKDAGSAAGDVPLLSGAITSSAENTPIVADGSGELKPHASGALGTAAFKNVGTASGSVPYNSSSVSLNATANGILVSDSVGIHNSNDTIDSVLKRGIAGAICDTSATSPIKDAYIADLREFPLYAGARITIFFKNAHTASGTVYLRINNGNTKAIVMQKNGTQYYLSGKTAKWRGASSEFYEVWQAKTILNLIYDGSSWQIEGNSILESYDITTNSYVVYADGRIEQWGHSTTQTSTFTVLTYLVPFFSETSYSINGNDVYDAEAAANVQMYNKTASSCKVNRQSYVSTNWDWRAFGY